MTNEELLAPRYKVIADWPNTDYEVGEIVDPMNIKFFDKYPHLFKKLEWWEERKAEDMPEYVKTQNKKLIVYKIDKWETGIDCFYFYTNNRQSYVEIERFHLPATEQEHNEYQSLKQ